jgi:hypothetical protein
MPWPLIEVNVTITTTTTTTIIIIIIRLKFQVLESFSLKLEMFFVVPPSSLSVEQVLESKSL